MRALVVNSRVERGQLYIGRPGPHQSGVAAIRANVERATREQKKNRRCLLDSLVALD